MAVEIGRPGETRNGKTRATHRGPRVVQPMADDTGSSRQRLIPLIGAALAARRGGEKTPDDGVGEFLIQHDSESETSTSTLSTNTHTPPQNETTQQTNTEGVLKPNAGRPARFKDGVRFSVQTERDILDDLRDLCPGQSKSEIAHRALVEYHQIMKSPGVREAYKRAQESIGSAVGEERRRLARLLERYGPHLPADVREKIMRRKKLVQTTLAGLPRERHEAWLRSFGVRDPEAVRALVEELMCP